MRHWWPQQIEARKFALVAITTVEITVGGENGSTNKTQKFLAGDVIFIEDLWWGVWDDDVAVYEKANDNDFFSGTGSTQRVDDVVVDKMKGYAMRASSEKETDLNVLMLTVHTRCNTSTLEVFTDCKEG